MHVVTYRPGGDLLDYQVATQCAHVLRLYQRPPGQRFLFGSTGRHLATVEQMLRSTMVSLPAAYLTIHAVLQHILAGDPLLYCLSIKWPEFLQPVSVRGWHM